ncbi:MAG: efflux RND transporter permease subunit [Candidatus Omnitrophica bacterium]|nr:efflux RND transporter permease subunit [Candidatus Omnitrophota bacterium]MDE2222224.1 efflux RND transporter permease subunit [Candidatus Omnitrophota bacterium]
MSKFFIDRPIFAWVISLLILLMGIVAITQLPVAQYPSVAPPSISVIANYAGASAETLQETVTSVIEQQLNGIDHLLYMSSSSNSSGQAMISLYFEPGTNPDTAQVQVQNKLQLALPSLPIVVQQAGVTVVKSTRNFLMFFTLSSTDGSMNAVDLGNYISAHVLQPISRLPGVGEADLFGTEYAMRVWMDPQKLYSYRLTAGDVIAALQAQNIQVPLGQLGARPAVKGQELNITLQGQGTLRSPKEFGNILLKVNPDGSRVYLRNVARVALAGLDYTTQAFINGRPSAAVAIKLTPTANAVKTADAIRAKVAELSQYFPPHIKVNFPLDQSAFVRISIQEVIKTLLIAIFLVFLVMYLFLQNFRTTLIPTIVVPVALMGTFTAMKAFGFSINVLTLFGMVLAIGMLVDDAIVVVENVERLMREEGLGPREASIKAMEQITGALVGISLVLTAVFIPMAFFGGSVGAIYRQFSLSLIASMLFSIFLALTMTPSLCASMLKPIPPGHHDQKRGFFGWFNRFFDNSRNTYQSIIARMMKGTVRYFLIYLAIIAAIVVLFSRLPSSFLPEEDQGYFITLVSLPVGATQQRTLKVLKQVEQYFLKQPEVREIITVAGFSFNGRGQNSALAFIRLKDWSQRPGAVHKAPAIIGRAFMAFSRIKDAIIYPVNLPPIPELGTSSGFDMELEDQEGLGHEKFMQAVHQLLGMAAKNPNVSGVRMQGLEDVPELKVNVDKDKASALGISLAELNTTMQADLGSLYVNNFVHGNRVQRVMVQLDAPFRMLPQDIDKIYVRNNQGKMVSLGGLVHLQWAYGSPQLQRYNGVPAIEIVGSAAPGKSTGQAMKAMASLVKKLPPGIGYEWTGQSYEELLSSAQAPALFMLSLIVVFLALAALYESWNIPFAVMLVVPLGILGSLLAATLRGLPNDVYFKVGLLAIIGLSAKNAILIVEFAKDLQKEGKELVQATLEAAHLRLRPILMTSMAFILGVSPLIFSNGAGSASQHDIGTGVAGGMLTATFLALLFVPIFFVSVRRLFMPKNKGKVK